MFWSRSDLEARKLSTLAPSPRYVVQLLSLLILKLAVQQECTVCTVVRTMRWPDWLSSKPTQSKDDTRSEAAPARPVEWSSSLNSTDWTQLTSPRTIIPTVLLTGTTLLLLRLYKLHLRRIPTSDHIKPSFFRKRSLFGYVTSVGDGDNFRLFHTPGGRLAGWGWFPGRRYHIQGKGNAKVNAKAVRDQTIHVRIAGVDAPERAHFGRPAQPFGDEALEGLRGLVLGRYVRARVWRRDQYERVVASVGVRNWYGRSKDLGLEMLKRGLCTVYEAKFGSEFGSLEGEYRDAERRARKERVGLWAKGQPGFVGRLLGEKSEVLETPRQYKERMQAGEKEKK